MPNPATLNLDSIVNVEVFISPQPAPRPTFNQGLIVGVSTHISVATRLIKCSSLTDQIKPEKTTSTRQTRRTRL